MLEAMQLPMTAKLCVEYSDICMLCIDDVICGGQTCAGIFVRFKKYNGSTGQKNFESGSQVSYQIKPKP